MIEPTNEQCAARTAVYPDGKRCTNEATEYVKIHSYLGWGNYGYIHANVCENHITNPKIINSAPMQYEGVKGEIKESSKQSTTLHDHQLPSHSQGIGTVHSHSHSYSVDDIQ